MKILEKEITTVEKESISKLIFSHKERLSDAGERNQRYQDLYRSQILGNISHDKVWIIFEDAQGMVYKVYTTIWALGEKFITLKGGVTIPISAVLKID